MRRQTHPHGLAVRWPLRSMDVDPFGLPVRYSLPVDCDADCVREARDFIEINRGSISVVHEVSGVPAVRRSLDLDDFSGVAIRIESVAGGIEGYAISVNLHHPDPKLCFPLHMACDMSEVCARWQSWSRALGLPLLLPANDGGWREPVSRLGKMKINPPCARPARLALCGRRSEISSVREMGDQALAQHVAGEELIARN